MVAMVTGTTVELVVTVVPVVAVVTPVVLCLVVKPSTLELREDDTSSLHNVELAAVVLVTTGCIGINGRESALVQSASTTRNSTFGRKDTPCLAAQWYL